MRLWYRSVNSPTQSMHGRLQSAMGTVSLRLEGGGVFWLWTSWPLGARLCSSRPQVWFPAAQTSTPSTGCSAGSFKGSYLIYSALTRTCSGSKKEGRFSQVGAQTLYTTFKSAADL